jgi:hypothetical protein
VGRMGKGMDGKEEPRRERDRTVVCFAWLVREGGEAWYNIRWWVV